MKKIQLCQIGESVCDALESKKKNVLFVSDNLDYEYVKTWFEEHPEYSLYCSVYPKRLSTIENGVLVETDYYCIDDKRLESLNDEMAILFSYPFGEQCIECFEDFLDIVKHRFYINRFSKTTTQKHSLEKMRMFIAFSTPANKDAFSLDSKYYDLFDEVYRIERNDTIE